MLLQELSEQDFEGVIDLLTVERFVLQAREGLLMDPVLAGVLTRVRT